MRKYSLLVVLFLTLLTGCLKKGPNPQDPYEAINRKTHDFNRAFDATVLRPIAQFYKWSVPAAVRGSVNNFYNNVYMIPTVANDLLQGELRFASDDAGRFLINSTIGMAGLFDVAANYHLPMRNTDLGVTFAKWGDDESPYIVIPFLGPSTIRDGMGMLFEYSLLTPYPFLASDAVLYGVAGLRYVDLRSQYLDTDHFIAESIDKYSFIRDAYLQHRHFLITGEEIIVEGADGGSLYVDE